MSRKGTETRQQIMDTAQGMILERGFSGTSVDNVISSLGLTKGAFFHHFNSKDDLATALIQRFVDQGMRTFDEFMGRARKFSDDPLQQLLLLAGLYEEQFDGLEEPYEGCLMAAYVYELEQFGEHVRPIISTEFLHWRRELTVLLGQIAKRYPPRAEVDLVALADMFISTFEGAFVVSKALQEPQVTAEQLRLYKAFIETLFKP